MANQYRQVMEVTQPSPENEDSLKNLTSAPSPRAGAASPITSRGNLPTSINQVSSLGDHLLQPRAGEVAQRRGPGGAAGRGGDPAPGQRAGGLHREPRKPWQSLSSQPVLIILALLAVYIVLGVLYESYVHP